MYLTAQRLRTVTEDESLVGYYYEHVEDNWDFLRAMSGPLAPVAGEVFLVRQGPLPMPPAGSRLRSYLDIAAPNGTGPSEIQQRFLGFRQHLGVSLVPCGSAPPWRWNDGLVYFACDMDEGRLAVWQFEVRLLLHQALSVFAPPRWTLGG